MKHEVSRSAGEAAFAYRRLKLNTEKVETAARYAVMLVRSGEATLTVRGKRYSLAEGDVAVTVDGRSYTLEASDDGCTLDEVSVRPYILGEKIRNALKRIHSVLRDGTLSDETTWLMSKIAGEAKSTDEYSEDASIALIHMLLVAVVRHGDTGAEPSKITAPVASALAYVNAHLGERLMLSEVASACEVSAAYLSRKFKSEMEIGFADYVARSRLERAGSMLREHPELSITEIAFSCGFNDSNYFSDKFKHHFGISPLKFRKK